MVLQHFDCNEWIRATMMFNHIYAAVNIEHLTHAKEQDMSVEVPAAHDTGCQRKTTSHTAS